MSLPGAVFATLSPQPADPLLGLIGEFRADSRPEKIDLGVGVYRDASGQTPVLQTVKAAELRLQQTQISKAYLGPEGNAAYAAALTRLVMGETSDNCIRCVQTPGGTGALRLAMDLVAKAQSGARVWVGMPTWPNHLALLQAAGLEVKTYPFFDSATQSIAFDAMMAALGSAAPGDIVLLHGCCHNPTGSDLTAAQGEALADLLAERGLMPLIDLAYQGLGQGFAEDGALMKRIVQRCGEALVAYSCDKNFALYRERVGALFVQARSAQTADAVFSNMLSCARANWSMPPDHGGAIVQTILDDEALRPAWQSEVDMMRDRIRQLRSALAASIPALSALAEQNGMFSLLPLAPAQIAALKNRYGIYMAGSGRINIAGLTPDNLPRFVAALNEVG